MKRFFGTDGIRGIANRDLTPELVFRIGRVIPMVLSGKNRGKFLVGKDPRRSSDMLEGALLSGLLSGGADVLRCGIIPTPGLSFLTLGEEADGGIMISASHNPLEHNGIKIFGKNGTKLSDPQEEEIESYLQSKEDPAPRPIGKEIGTVSRLENARGNYTKHLKSFFSTSLAGMHIVLDCAYGATSVIAPELFKSLGASVSPYCATPDGLKINENCGATHLELLQKATLDNKGDIGIAFDGDGDRVIFVNHKGEILNGDSILATLAYHWKKKGRLRGAVVTTVMANFGLEEALLHEKIPVVRTPVGDRFVLEEMIRLNSNLGGEQSGHIILLDQSRTGDGCLTALHFLSAVLESGKEIRDLKIAIKQFPQLLVNIPVEDKERFQTDLEIKKVIETEEIRLRGRGRIVVRLSGTEPLVRVMAEGPDPVELQEVVGRVRETIEMRLA